MSVKATALKIEGNDVKLPSHVDIVEGLSTYVDGKIHDYDSSTVTTRINGLQSVYLAINGKAADATKADNAVYATTAGGATTATNDSSNQQIDKTYIKAITSGSTSTITYTKGDGSTGTFTLPKANALSTARTITLKGGATGSTTFDGSSNVTINVGNINASSITSGALSTARGGTGTTNGTVAKLSTPQYINGQPFDGSKHVLMTASCTTAASEPTKVLTMLDGTALELNTNELPCIAARFNNINTATSAVSIKAGDSVLPFFRNNAAVTGPFTSSVYAPVMIRCTGNRWEIVEASNIRKIMMTGDVQAWATLAGSDTINIETTVDQTKAFQAIIVDSATVNYDLNNLNQAGYFRIGHIQDFINRPVTSTGDCYMQVLKSPTLGTFIQILYTIGSDMMHWERAIINGVSFGHWIERTGTVTQTYTGE